MAKATWQKTEINNLYKHSNGIYYARLYVGGKEKWRSLRTKLKEAAKYKLREYLKAAQETRSLASGDDGKKTFGQFMAAETELITRSAKLKKRSKDYKIEIFDAIRANWPGIENMQVNRLTDVNFSKWASSMEHKYSANRYNNMLAAMRGMIKKARKGGIIFADPTEDVTRASVRTRDPKLPSIEKFNQWVEEIDKVHGRGGYARGQLVRFLAYSGLRVTSEARWVTWGDVDFNEGIMFVRGHPETGTKNERGRQSAKQAEKPREIPLFPKLLKLLKDMREARADEPDTNTVLQVFEAQKSMDRAAKAIGMPRLTHHDLRRWFTTLCVESNVDVGTVGSWRGDKDNGAFLLKTYFAPRREHSLKAAGQVAL